MGITGTVLVYGTTTTTGDTFNEKSASPSARVVVTGKVDGYDSVTHIKGGAFNGNGNNVFYHLSPAWADDGFEVSGGTFDLHQKWGGSSRYLFNCIDDACAGGSANVAISGGTFVDFDPSASPRAKARATWLPAMPLLPASMASAALSLLGARTCCRITAAVNRSL